MKDDQVRIFVSSPADVDHERAIVKDVIERLSQEYSPYFRLRAILWEDEALTADRTFQAGLTQPSECEIVLVILWTRLGSPLPDDPYRGMTGTEWEFVDAVTSSNLKGQPDVLVYKKATPKLVDITDAETAQEAIADRRRLEDFFRTHFFNEDNTFRRAFRTFDSDAQFRELVEIQVRKLLNRRISAERRAAAGERQWRGSPFRADQAFDIGDERVFTGREAELRELTERLAARAETGRGFLLLTGPSGCGKTSLLRAGLVPRLTRPFRFEGIATVRCCLLELPSAGEEPLQALAAALCAEACLGSPLRSFGLEAADLAALFLTDPTLAARQIAAALMEASRTQTLDGRARLALVVDSLETLFHREGAPAAATSRVADGDPAYDAMLDAVADALAALALHGDLWVVAALRSDALPDFARLPALTALLDDAGWQHLEPLPSTRIRQVVEIPARIAGISLDSEMTGPQRGLVELIEAEASRLRLWLPPVQALLNAAFQSARLTADDDLGDVRLDAQHWRQGGGLAGQVLSRATAIWAEQADRPMRDALPRLCRALITIDHQQAARPQARAGDLRVLAHDEHCRRLIAVMVEARLLIAEAEQDQMLITRCEQSDYSLGAAALGLLRQATGDWIGRVGGRARARGSATSAAADQRPARPADDPSGRPELLSELTAYRPIVSFAHPVLLERWEPIAAWLSDPEHRAQLHLRAQLTRQAREWKRTSCNREYLLGEAGFAAVRPFAESFADELDPLETDFLRHSGSFLAFLRQRNRLVRGFGFLLILLLLTASAAAWVAQRKSVDARLALHRVQLKEANLNSLGGNTPQAVAKALDAGVDLPAEAIRVLSLAFSRNRLIAMTTAPAPSPDTPYLPAANADGDLLATLLPERGARKWRLADGRFVPADAPVLSDGTLGIHQLVVALDDDRLFGVSADGVFQLPAFQGDRPAYPCGTAPGAALALDAARRRLALAVPLEDGNQGVCVLDLTEPGKVLFQRDFAEQELRGLDFSPDGSALLTASALGRAHLIDLKAAAGEDAIEFSMPAERPLGRPFNKAVFDSSGQRIGIAAVDERVRLYRRNGRSLGELMYTEVDGRRIQVHNSAVRDLAFAPDGRALVAVDDEGQVVRWSLGERPQAVVLGHHELSIVSVAVGDPAAARPADSGSQGADAARGSLVLTASLDRTARLWSLQTGKPLAVFGHDGALAGARFAKQAERVLSHSVRDGSVRLWSVTPVSRLAFELNHPNPSNHIWHLDMAPVPAELSLDRGAETDADRVPIFLATAGWDGEVQVWRFDRDGKAPQLSDSFSQDERVQGAAAAQRPIKPVRRVQFSPSGRLLAAARFDGSARVHDLLTGRSCRLMAAGAPPDTAAGASEGKVFRVLFGPREQWLLTTSDDPAQPVRLFDPRRCVAIDDLPALGRPGTATEAAAVRALAEETLVATGDNGGKVRLLRVDATGAWSELCAMDPGIGAVSDLAIAPDGGLLAMAGEAHRLALLAFDKTGCQQVEYASGHSGALYSVAFSPDGRQILTASLDKTARVWNRAGQALAILAGHQDRIYHAAFSPNSGHWVLTASRDGSLRLWRAPADEQAAAAPLEVDTFLPLEASLGGAAFGTFSPSGRYVAGAYWENAALLWRVWREDALPNRRLTAEWGPDRSRLALLKEAYRFRRDNRVSEAEAELPEVADAKDAAPPQAGSPEGD